MARGRAAGYDDQRELILTHAAHLFAHRGYPATTMNDVAAACGYSKATLYHYYKDKYSLLVSIADHHVSALHKLVQEVQQSPLPPTHHLRTMIERIVKEYAGAQDAHRVLTEDVKFLQAGERETILDKERAVVAGFAKAVQALHPDMKSTALTTPLTMLLFGMINWMFTWMRPDGAIGYEAMAKIVADLFIGGLQHVRLTPDIMGTDREKDLQDPLPGTPTLTA
jgi:AcrR family transcriptional regulator